MTRGIALPYRWSNATIPSMKWLTCRYLYCHSPHLTPPFLQYRGLPMTGQPSIKWMLFNQRNYPLHEVTGQWNYVSRKCHIILFAKPESVHDFLKHGQPGIHKLRLTSFHENALLVAAHKLYTKLKWYHTRNNMNTFSGSAVFSSSSFVSSLLTSSS